MGLRNIWGHQWNLFADIRLSAFEKRTSGAFASLYQLTVALLERPSLHYPRFQDLSDGFRGEQLRDLGKSRDELPAVQ